jgi:hypothetical protein
MPRGRTHSTSFCVEPLTDPFGPQMSGLGPRVIEASHRQVEFRPMAFQRPAVIHATIDEGPIQQNLVLLEERQHTVIKTLRRRHWCLAVAQRRKTDLTVRVEKDLRIRWSAPFKGADIAPVLHATVTGAFALEFGVRFFVRGLLQGHDLYLHEDEPFWGHLRLQRLPPFLHRLQLMPKLYATDAIRLNG